MILLLILLGFQTVHLILVKRQCGYEKSGYFVILNKLTFDEAAMACVEQGSVLAPYVPSLSHLVETCAEWEMDTLEPWIARRIGDLQCPFVRRGGEGDNVEQRIALDDCSVKSKRPAVCWRYPIALKTITQTHIVYSTLTDYNPSIVTTVLVAPTSHSTLITTFTWTNTVVHTKTKQKRVPRYLFEYSSGAPNATLTDTIEDTVTIVKQVPSATVTEEALIVAVAYSTLWSTEHVATETLTVSINCI